MLADDAVSTSKLATIFGSDELTLTGIHITGSFEYMFMVKLQQTRTDSSYSKLN